MSERRRARAGQVAQAARSGVPAPLRDREDPLWQDAAAVARLVKAHGLRLNASGAGGLQAMPAWARFDAFRAAWIAANGLEHPQWPRLPDWTRARAAGIDMTSSARHRLRSD